MRLAPLVVLALGVIACSQDPCSGHDGVCVRLELVGAVDGSELDGVSVDLRQPFTARRQLTGAEAHTLPITTALELPAFTGDVAFGVTATRGGIAVGVGDATSTVARSDQRLSLTVTLSPTAARNDDLGTIADLGGADLAGAVDLAGSGGSDGGNKALDPTHQLVFVSSGFFAGDAWSQTLTPDVVCELDAAGQFTTNGKPFYALLAKSGRDLKSLVSTTLPAALPTGTVVAGAGNLFNVSKTIGHAIDEFVTGKNPTTLELAWTGFYADGSSGAPSCGSFTTTADVGATGSPYATDQTWAAGSTSDACTAKYHVYCIEGP